jgi:tetratricopeptide (TPR) repeat protein
MTGETVDKDLWIGTARSSIEDLDRASLAEMRRLRRALGHDVEASEVAFLAQLRKLTDSKVIVVLPFETITSKGKTIEPLLDMSDQISLTLSGVSQLIVRPMHAVLQKSGECSDPLTIGRELDADFVLGGEIVCEGEGFNATAQLTSMDTGTSVWTDHFDRSIRDIPKVEALISVKVIQRLNLQLTKLERERLTQKHDLNPDAYQKYKLGRFYLNQYTQESLDQAIKYFSEAKEHDPTFAKAYSGLADAFTAKGIYNIAPPKESFSEALKYANQALDIDPTVAEAHASLAYAYMCYERNWTAAESSFRRALELNPNCALAFQGLAHLLGAMGRFPEALREIDRALKIDPTSPFVNTARGFVFYYARRFEEGRAHLHHAVNINKHFDATYYVLGLVCEQIALARRREGCGDEAHAMFLEAEKADRKAIKYSGNNFQKFAKQAATHALSGEKDKALRELDQLNSLQAKEHISPFHLATVYAALEMFQEALDRLEEAFEKHDQWIMLLNVDPRFDVLRKDPRSRERFEKLIRSLKFPLISG